MPHVLAAVTGLAAVMHTSALAFSILKYLGVAYLLYMAWSTVRDTEALTVEKGAPVGAGRVIASGVLINLLNPKLTLFFFAFLPQFVPADAAHASLQMLQLSAVFMAVTFAVFAVYGLVAAALREQVLARPRVLVAIRRTFGAAFVALAGRLAFAAR